MNSKAIYEAEWADQHCLSIQQLCQCARVEQTLVLELVEREVLQPNGHDHQQWLFHPADLSRLNRATRLMHEFDLSPTGLALVFDLLDELQQLRT